MATYTIFTTAADGYIQSQTLSGRHTWSNADQGNGNINVSDTDSVWYCGVQRGLDGTWNMYDNLHLFDTSVIADGEQVDEATVSFYPTFIRSGASDFRAYLYDWSPTVDSTDWIRTSSLGISTHPQLGSIPLSNMSANTYADMPVDAAYLDRIDPAGTTEVRIVSSDRWDTAFPENTAQQVNTAFAEHSSGGPKITLTTSEAATPVSISVPTATASADAPAATVTASASVSLDVPAATADADAVDPTVAISASVSVDAPTATASADAVDPTVAIPVVVDAPVATASAEALAPSVDAGGVQIVVGAPGTAEGALPPPSISTAAGATLSVPVATVSADALAPSTTSVQHVSLAVLVATAQADARSPRVRLEVPSPDASTRTSRMGGSTHRSSTSDSTVTSALSATVVTSR